MYTITHACGHTEDHETKHGYLQPETVRFLAASDCTACSAINGKRYQVNNPYARYGGQPILYYSDIQFAKRDANDWIARGLPRVDITDNKTGRIITVTR